jgi:hypothetical protein
MTPDPPPAPVVDPNLAAEQAKAAADQTAAAQDRAAMDTASVMARYGSQMSLANTLPPTSVANPATITAPSIALPPPLAAPSLR